MTLFLLRLPFPSTILIMSAFCPFITAAVKASLMDMKAQSIDQERELRGGWVTVFLLLDKRVMPRSVSRDVADWCLSFISAPLIWRSSCFIIISAENPYRIIVPFPSVLTCRAGRTVSFKTKAWEGRRWRAAALSPMDSLKEIKIKESRLGWRVFFLFFLFFKKEAVPWNQTVIVKWHSWEEVAGLLWCRRPEWMNKQTNRGARRSAITDLCSKKPSNLFPLYLIRKSRGIFNVHGVNGKQLTGAN